MITSTSIAHESLVTKLKIALHQAAFSNTRQAIVHNRKGKAIIVVQYVNNRFSFYHQNKDVSGVVLRGVKRYHSSIETN